MRKNNFEYLDTGIEYNLHSIVETSGEMVQLESVMYLLDGLMGWCELCFNNDQEEIDYNKLQKSYKLLEEVHKSYENNY